MKTSSKLKLLQIIDILQQTDPDHPISTAQIVTRLKQLGTSSERKSVLRDINLLVSYGYEIFKDENPRKGYYMIAYIWENWEIKLLTDLVASIKFLSEEEISNLIDKLLRSAPQTLKNSIYKTLLIEEPCTAANKYTKYSIDEITTAITMYKKISFKYAEISENFCSQNTKTYKNIIATPYMLLLKDMEYYLFAKAETEADILPYRLACIQNVRLLPNSCGVPATALAAYTGETYVRNCAAAYVNSPNKDKIELVLQFEEPLLKSAIDFFGSECIQKISYKKFVVTKTVCKNMVLQSFLLQNSPYCRVLAPAHLHNEIKELITLGAKNYSSVDNIVH